MSNNHGPNDEKWITIMTSLCVLVAVYLMAQGIHDYLEHLNDPPRVVKQK